MASLATALRLWSRGVPVAESRIRRGNGGVTAASPLSSEWYAHATAAVATILRPCRDREDCSDYAKPKQNGAWDAVARPFF